MVMKNYVGICSGCCALLFAILAAFVFPPPQQYQDYVREMHERISPDKSKIVKTPCGMIEYGQDGPEDGPPVLVVHGAMGGFDQGLLFGKPFVEKGYQIIAPSRFGYLRTPLPSEREPPTVSEQAKAYNCLLDALQITNKVLVYGASAGAPSSLKFAHKYPDRIRALVLEVPAITSIVDPQTHQPYSKLPLGALFMGPMLFLPIDIWHFAATKLAAGLLVSTLGGTPPYLYREASVTEKNRIDEFIARFFPSAPRLDGVMVENDLKAESVEYMDEIRAPTLTISYQDDRYGTFDVARTIADRIPGARFVGYSKGGHLGIGHVQEVFDEIHAFLEGIKVGDVS